MQPEKKTSQLITYFQDKVFSHQYIQEGEELKLYGEMRNVDKSSAEGKETWAFYYAYQNNQDEALSFFRDSKAYNQPMFLYNYLAYLLNCGLIDLFIEEVGEINKYPVHKSFLDIKTIRYFLLGDIEKVQETLKTLKVIDKQNIDKYQGYIYSLQSFVEHSQLTLKQLKKLFSIVTNILKDHKLSTNKYVFALYPEHSINSVVIPVVEELIEGEKLADINWQLSLALAKADLLSESNFVAMFDIL